MTKLIFNIDKLRNNVIPSIDNAVDNLTEAIAIGSQLYIPSDFINAEWLQDMNYNNQNTKKSLIQVKDWINQSNAKINEKLGDINSELSSINNVEIKKRESSIK